MYLFYLSFVKLYAGAISIASLFNKKAKLWVNGRRGWKEQLQKHTYGLDNVYWFHCASLGEFDQAVPIMEKLKESNPSIHLVVSFFSPSGYEIKKDYSLASYTCYLPMDGVRNAKQFVSIVNPQKAFFIKYEVWASYFKELNRKNVPFYMVSSTFRENQIYFKWYGKWFLNLLKLPSEIFVQNKASKDLLSRFNIESTLSGDTRYDKVKQNAQRKESNELIELFKGEEQLLITGSSWEPEEFILSKAYSNYYKLIIAPHNVEKGNINRIVNLFPSALKYSQANKDNIKQSNVLIIDCIGILSNIYQYGDLAFIGGGFKNGLHNILEPATFGLPVIFGPHRDKYPESQDMIEHGSGFEIKNDSEFKQLINSLFTNSNHLEALKRKNLAFINDRLGAAEVVVKRLKKSR